MKTDDAIMKIFARILLCVALSSVAMSMYGNSLNEPSVIFEGYLIYTNNFLPTHETKTLHFSFQRKGCTWLLKSGIEERNLGYTETGFDGTNEYRFTYWNTDQVEKARADKKKAYFVTGQVAPNSIPDFDAAWSRHIWFALMPYSCSSMTAINPCDLVTGTKVITNCNRILFPTFDVPGSYVTKATVWSQGNDILDDGSVVPLAPPFDKGFTNLIFSSSLVEWSGGLEAPTNFEYHVYGAMGKSPTLLWSLYGTITNVTTESEFSPIPEIIDATYIVDFRATNFGNKQIIHYISTNGWLKPSDPEFRKLVSIGNEAVMTAKHATIVRIFLIGFAIAGLIPIFLAWKKGREANLT